MLSNKDGALLRTDDYALRARDRLPAMVWDYIAGGSGDELSVEANDRAYRQARIAPRVLVDVSACDATTSLLGSQVAAPIGVAPTAYHELVHPEAEIGMVRGAGAAGMLSVISIFATRPVEQIAAAATGPLWLQLYWLRRREALRDLARRAEACGFTALMLTVDAPRLGRRWRDARNGFAVPPRMRAVNLDPALTGSTHDSHAGASALATHAEETFDTTITWADLAWLRSLTELPLVVKGILTAEDAALAVAHGAAGLVVSNHGGRQIDGAIAALHALPAIVDAVAGRATVLVDGGIRTGRDVFVALALGADGVLLGRLPLWALAVGGGDAVGVLLQDMHGELLHTMALAGRPRLADLGPEAVLVGGHC